MFSTYLHSQNILRALALGSCCLLAVPAVKAQSPVLNSYGTVSIDPSVEKNDIRVTLQASIQKKNELSVLVKVSNFSAEPVFVSPDAVEMSTEEGFIILPSNGVTPDSDSHWSKISKVAALIPFADPYQIISKTQKVADFAKKTGLLEAFENKNTNRHQLREVILQPGMATHGLIIYNAASLNAFSYNPRLHIRVVVSSEPFEFVFNSSPFKTAKKPL